MSTGANTAQLRRLADEVLTGHNLAALDGIFHADYVEDEPPPGMGPGRDGLRQCGADRGSRHRIHLAR